MLLKKRVVPAMMTTVWTMYDTMRAALVVGMKLAMMTTTMSRCTVEVAGK